MQDEFIFTLDNKSLKAEIFSKDESLYKVRPFLENTDIADIINAIHKQLGFDFEDFTITEFIPKPVENMKFINAEKCYLLRFKKPLFEEEK